MLVRHLFIFIFLTGSAEAIAASCNQAQSNAALEAAKKARDTILVDMEKRDISKEVATFRANIEKCDLSLAQFGVGRAVYDVWLRRSYSAELARTKKIIEENSYYQNVDIEVGQYRVLKQKLQESLSKDENALLNNAQLRGRVAHRKLNTNCKPMDIRKKMGPVRNQDSVGWCYGYSTADIVGFYSGKKISAAEIAIQHNQEKFFYSLRKDWFDTLETNIEGGNQEPVLRLGNSIGYCLESDFPSEDNAGASIMAIVASYEKNYRELRDRDKNCKDELQNSIPPQLDNLLEQVSGTVKNSEYLKALVNTNCKTRVRMPLNVESVRRDGRNNDFVFAAINDQLDKGEPSSISYHSSILIDPDAQATGAHASLVVGRRFNKEKNSCEYLIRNSWGPSCEYYSEKLTCEEGNIWVPSDVLYRGVFETDKISR